MRVVYIPHNQKDWEQFFSLKAVQSGAGMIGFRGSAYQRGGGFGSLLGSLFRSFLPIAKTVGKTVGKQALRTGAEVASDALQGRDIGQSFEERGRSGAAKLLVKGMNRLDGKEKKNKRKKRKPQKGRGLGYRPAKKQVKHRLRVSRRKRVRRDQLGDYFA